MLKSNRSFEFIARRLCSVDSGPGMSLIIHHINEWVTYLLESFYLAMNLYRHYVEFLQARGGLENTADDANSRRIAGSEGVFTQERQWRGCKWSVNDVA